MEKQRMNKKSLVALGLLVAGYSMTASAVSDNTISFQGEVSDQTCEVTVNSDSAPVVLMPTAAASALTTAGSVAGKTSFDIALSGCTAATTATTINTMFSGNLVDTANQGTLTNTGTATNVNLQLLDTDGSAIDLSSTWTSTKGELSLAETDTASSATFFVQYYATDAATAGTVAGSVEYAVSYL
ncbi:fimbrial protein [Rahnella inusitata]|uniref:fimbrial protein n=1 Tax=Rahnella inusitata TaxID=58169 RepID=UPI0039BE4D4D